MLKKLVYGLNDPSHNSFFSVRKELLSFYCLQSTHDKAIFRWYENAKLSGLFVLHVDDCLYACTGSFISQVVKKICLKFQIGSQGKDCVKYIGFENMVQITLLLHKKHIIILSMKCQSQ